MSERNFYPHSILEFAYLLGTEIKLRMKFWNFVKAPGLQILFKISLSTVAPRAPLGEVARRDPV